MDTLYIICVDDQQEVLNALENDLASFDEKFNLEVCDSGQEVLDLMDQVDAEGDLVALVITDQVMPGMTGVELLKEIQADERFLDTEKMLLTGQATHQDTIEAINLGGIDQYLAKPWQKEDLHDKVRALLTHYVFKKGIEYTEYQEFLDQSIIYNYLRKGTV
jgi:two-component system chemotaxis response regulator CheY